VKTLITIGDHMFGPLAEWMGVQNVDFAYEIQMNK
jgi:hypothetical protein